MRQMPKSGFPVDPDYFEGLRDAFDSHLTRLREGNSVRDRDPARHYLVGPRQRRNSRGLMNATTSVPALRLARIRGVHSDPHPGRKSMQPPLLDEAPLDRDRAVDR